MYKEESADPCRIHLPTAIVKEDSVSYQSRIDLCRYGWIHLHTAIVKEESVSCQSSTDLFRCGWIYLRVDNDSLFLLFEQVKAVQLPHFSPL
jgi:hypothetical protein